MKRIVFLFLCIATVMVSLISACGGKNKYLVDGEPPKEPTYYVSIAHKEFGLGITDKAHAADHFYNSMEAAKAALILDPKNSEALFWLGHSSVHQGLVYDDTYLMNDGLSKFRISIEINPSLAAISYGPPLPLTVAWYHFRKNFFCDGGAGDIIALLREAIQLKPKFPLSHSLLSRMYKECNNPELALQEAKIAADLAPDNARLQLEMADLYYHIITENKDRIFSKDAACKGINAYKKAIKLEQGEPEALDKLAYLYGIIEQYELKIHTLKTAIEIENTPLRHEKLAITFLEIGDIEKAKKQFMTILKTNQDHLNSRKGLAFCYYLEEKYDLASNQMNKASEAFRSNSVYEALFNYYALLGSGKTSESKSYLTKYNDFFSGSEWSKCILAYHLGVTSENDLLEKSQNEKNLCQAYFYIGCRYWHTGAPKKAYQWFNKASAIESDDFEYYCAKVRLTQLSALYGLAKK